jgi:hypothetical protein
MKWTIGVTIITSAVHAALRLRLWYWQRQVRKNEARLAELNAQLAAYDKPWSYPHDGDWLR